MKQLFGVEISDQAREAIEKHDLVNPIGHRMYMDFKNYDQCLRFATGMTCAYKGSNFPVSPETYNPGLYRELLDKFPHFVAPR